MKREKLIADYLRLESVTKRYRSLSGKTVEALANLSLSLIEGEFLTIVGPSGAGKSTLLNILAGLDKPTSGRIIFSNKLRKPRIGFVFQSETIFPWRTVERNLTYALELEGIRREGRKQRAEEICRLIGLAPEVFLGKYPKELSGGEKRRVAIGMALAYEADLLLLDEPTSQLDYLSRWDLQQTILDIWSKRRFTTVLVTHDLEEAVYLSDRVLVLEDSTRRAILRIDLPRPRTPALRDSEDFRDLRNQLIDCHNTACTNDQSVTA